MTTRRGKRRRRTHLPEPPGRVVAVLLALLVGCAATAAQPPDDGSGPAGLSVFVAGSKRAGPPLVLSVVGLAALAESGDEVPLTAELDRLESAALAGKQRLLASGSLAPGLYRGLRLSLARSLPPTAESPAREVAFERRLSADFRAGPGELVTLVVELDLTFAPRPDGSLPDEAFVLRRSDRNVVRSLAVYVTDELQHRVVAVNRDDDRVFGMIPVGRSPRGIDVTTDGRRAYVVNAGDDTVSVLDPLNHRVLDTVPLKAGCRPEDVAVALEGRRLVVACPGLNSLAVLDPVTNASIGEVALARAPERLAAAADGRTVYALVPEGNQVIAADLLRLQVGGPTAVIEAQPADLAVDRGGGSVYVSHARAPVLSVLDAQLRPDRRLQVGAPSYGIALEADGRRLYVAGGAAGGVSILGARLGTVIRRWPTPPGFRVALDPDGRKVYVTGGDSGELLVLDRIAGRLIGRVPVGRRAVDLVVVP